jgi:photosystem II stability/assembly factor-like uncharacterized protein
VTLSSPSPGASFSRGAAIPIEAQVSDRDGSVVRVEFFAGVARLATIVTGPFVFMWSGATDGSHSLTAIATDDAGASSTSAPVQVSVFGPSGGGPGFNQPPTVSVRIPASGQSFVEGAPISLEAEASDVEGPVARVDFFDGTTLVGTATQSPWRISWTGAPPGQHSLRAVATDGGGTSSSSFPVAITVLPRSGGIVVPPTPSPPQGSLRGVFFANSLRGWTVGEAGGIWRTDDGGTTWVKQPSGATARLNRVQFVSPDLGWVVGDGGTILRTQDGGDHWSVMTSGTVNDLLGLSFAGGTSGWAVGAEGTILRTVDGGVNWTSQNSGTAGPINCVSFVTPSAGWAGGIEILSTSDGGSRWDSRSAEFLSFTGVTHVPEFFDVRFLGANRGTFVGVHRGGDVIFTTTDGGETFKIIEPHDNFARLHGVAFGDATHLWAVGTRGPFAATPTATILASTDGGLTWTDQIPPTGQTLNGVWFISATTGWAVGESGTVIRTTDGGATWQVISSGS